MPTPQAASVRQRERIILVLVAVAACIIALSSVFLCADNMAISQNRAYMGTDAKAFEPMLGALAAILVSYPTIAA